MTAPPAGRGTAGPREGAAAAYVLLLVAAVPPVSTLRHGQTAALAALFLAVFAVVVRAIVRGLPLRARHLAALPLLGAVLLSYSAPVVSLVTATSRHADLTGLVGGLALLAAATAAPPSARRLARTIGLAGAAEAAAVICRDDHADGRLEGLGLNPNYLGLLAAVPLVACVGLASVRRAPAWLLPAVPCLAAVVATQSRGAFLAAAAGVAVLLLSGRSLQTRILVTAGIAAVLLLLPGGLGAVENSGASERAAAELSYNDAVREHAARFAFDAALAHPMRGIGYGMFAPYAAASPSIGVYINNHDDYLRIGAEAGLPCLALLLALLVWACKDPRTGGLAVLRALVVAYAVGLLFANALSNLAVSAPFWAALGCLISQAPLRRSGAPPLKHKEQTCR